MQSLRHDSDGITAGALLTLAGRSDVFAHQLQWALMTEEQPPQEAFNPEVKRSGWEPPKDYGLWKVRGGGGGAGWGRGCLPDWSGLKANTFMAYIIYCIVRHKGWYFILSCEQRVIQALCSPVFFF